MTQELKPVIRVHASPAKISKGQMLSVTVNIVDRYTLVPMIFDKIYMEIVDEKGVPVWPLSLIEEEAASFSKLISTADMKPGTKYTIRISPSDALRPLGQTVFETDARIIEPAFLIPGIMLIPKLLLPANDVIEPESPEMKIAWLVYRTQLDSKVCNICSPHEGERYRPNDPNIVKIGDKEHGGDTHYGCRCHYDIITAEDLDEIYQALFVFEKENEESEMREVFGAYLTAKSYWRQS